MARRRNPGELQGGRGRVAAGQALIAPLTLHRQGPTLRAMPRTSDATPSPVADFEASLDQLEQLVEKMEHGEMSLEESLAAYERGVGLYRKCQTALEQAELRVRLLSDPEQPDNAEPFGAPSADA
jgi:exodeoxyribonuclease VII small subunit